MMHESFFQFCIGKLRSILVVIKFLRYKYDAIDLLFDRTPVFVKISLFSSNLRFSVNLIDALTFLLGMISEVYCSIKGKTKAY